MIQDTKKGFTMIELLVVVSILGILLALSIFGMQGARQASRDGKRKADLEQIRSGLEIYKADCGTYLSGTSLGTSLKGNGSSSNCPITNTYIATIPTDPLSTNHSYIYYSDGATYAICAALETGSGSVTCGSTSNCGGTTCNYKVVNP